MDPISGLAAIKGITAGLDGINKLLGVIKDTAHREQLLQLKEALLSAKEEAVSLREEVLALRSKLSNKENLTYNKGVDAYYKQVTATETDGPFCKTCWDKDSKLLRLDREGWCAGCEKGYGPERSSGGWEPASS